MDNGALRTFRFHQESCPKEPRFPNRQPNKTAISNRRSLKKFNAALIYLS